MKYIIELSDTDRKTLTDIVTKGSAPAKTILRANILLASDRNNKKHMTVDEIAENYHTTPTTVQNVRTSYANNGLEATITRKKRETPPVPPKVTGEVEAHIIALACGDPPEGYEKWTLRLLADKCVELNYAESFSHMTVSRVLKNEFKPNLKKCWCIPPDQSAAFVAAMEDVLSVYARPYDEAFPVICMDEKPVQLFANARKSLRSADGRIEYEDNEYIRNGTASIFMFTEPLSGWRIADAQEHRTREDWAKQIKWLFLYLHSVRIISLTSSRTTPYIFFLRYFGINTIWYWHSHLQCAKLEPSIGRLLCFEFGLQHLAQYSTGGFYFRTPNTFSSSHPSLAGGLGLSFIFQMCENYYTLSFVLLNHRWVPFMLSYRVVPGFILGASVGRVDRPVW